MNKDIRLSVGFFDHPKTIKLQRKLGHEGVTSLLRLWIFASNHKHSGVLSSMDAEEIAIAANWLNDSLTFVETLVTVRYLEFVAGEYVLHDWVDHNGYASSAVDRSDKSRFSRMAKTHKDIYLELKEKGVDAVSSEDFKRLTNVQRPFNDSLTERISPLPLPSPSPSIKKDLPKKKISAPALSSDHTIFTAWWMKSYRNRTGYDYIFAGGKDGAAVKKILAATKDIDDAILRGCSFLLNLDDFTKKNLTIAFLLSRLSSCLPVNESQIERCRDLGIFPGDDECLEDWLNEEEKADAI